MKNVHILPTDKPSIVALLPCGTLEYSKTGQPFKETIDWKLQNIYIISDEEIKDKMWVWDKKENRITFLISLKKDSYNKNVDFNKLYSKIILTIDQDLIKDGVQAIDDEFLEWFVKNSSCEKVEVFNDKEWNKAKCNISNYKIIIPKEEPKQETLEEASEKFINSTRLKNLKSIFCEGAKWQQERSYSEEEVLQLLNKREQYLIESVGEFYQSNLEWFEQFKKK